jgi:Recombination endonuclease VII
MFGSASTRYCPRCRKNRDATLFANAAGKPCQSCQPCRDLSTQLNRQRRARIGAQGIRAANLRDKYGITVEEYDALRARQGYRCAICARHEEELRAAGVGRPRLDGTPSATAVKLVVDHCHQTGRVRGLLCVGCNAALGHLDEREDRLLAAIAYLRRVAAAET